MVNAGGSEPESIKNLREELLEKYHEAATKREDYLLRRQRKEILDQCRLLAIVGMSTNPNSESYVRTEKLLGLGVKAAFVLPGYEECLGFPCYPKLRDVPDPVDIVQVYPREGVDIPALALEAVQKGVGAFWVEEGPVSPEVKDILAGGSVHVVEHESLEREYCKHAFFPAIDQARAEARAKPTIVGERMTKDPVTITEGDTIREAMDRMKRGRFRHLPVIDDLGKLIGMLSDRDVRLIGSSLALRSREEAEAQLWSTVVRQIAVFDPISVRPEARLEEAANLMLRWEVGGLPVVSDEGLLLGIVTYTDLLREFVARGMPA